MDDKAEGLGKLLQVNGDLFIGHWSDDKKEGYGVFTWSDGKKYEGLWRNGK